MAVLVYLYRFFCSLKLAVFTLSAMILLFATGTFYESAQGREVAKELIYDSVYMNVLLSLLALNITAVMLDRFPWRKKHIPFLLAHFGILFVIAGAFITRFYGVDGHIRLSPGETGQYITGQGIFLNVYASFDGQNLSRLSREQVFFFRHPPSENKPYTINLGQTPLKITDFYPLTTVREMYKPTDRGGTALRFLVEGSRGQTARWLFRPPYQEKAELTLGLVQIILLKSLPVSVNTKEQAHTSSARTGHALLLAPDKSRKPTDKSRKPTDKSHKPTDKSHKPTNKSHKPTDKSRKPTDKSHKPTGKSRKPTDNLQYQLIKSGKILEEGVLKKGSILKTGWMDFQLRLLEYWPNALPHRVFTPLKKKNEEAVPAVQVQFKGESKWMGLNSQLFFFDKDKVYIVAYGNEQQKLSFSLKLLNFKVQHYPFSRKARSYQSEVQVNEKESVLISMNKPLKWDTWTVYQSGFEEDENGKPLASVFSINKDPGRFVKYFGSLLVVLGVLMLFSRRNSRGKIRKYTDLV